MFKNFSAVSPYIGYIFEGVFVTLKFTSISIFLGLMLGTFLAILKISSCRGLKKFAQFYTSVFRGTPLLVQLSLVYFATPQLFGYKISAFEAGVLTFSLNSAAYVSEIMRGGILAVDRGQFEAAFSLGLPYRLVLKDIIIPQAFKTIMPALVNEMIDLIKESALVSVIGEYDLLRRANVVSAKLYIYFEPLLIVAAVYYFLVMILSQCARKFENWMRQYD